MSIANFIRLPLTISPTKATQLVVNIAYHRILARHPSVFDRLGDYVSSQFCFVPTDLPICFQARPRDRSISVRRKADRIKADVKVEGTFEVLLRLLEGGADGDALFFSRQINVTGDMEALLALRNSLDDTGIDLVDDLFGESEFFSSLARLILKPSAADAGKGDGRWN